MMKRLFFAATLLLMFVACSEEQIVDPILKDDVLTACVEVEAASTSSRAYDASLKWSWEADDQLLAYQVSGAATRNTLTLVEGNRFRCEAFQYATNDASSFHFVYPAAAETCTGSLTAVQDGTWRPVAVATVANATVNSLMTVDFTPLTAALEVRVWTEDKSQRKVIAKAVLSSDSDFVGVWTLQNDMTYVQSLSGKEIALEGLSSDVVTFNMSVNESGFEAGALQLMLTDAAGNTTTVAVPALTFVKGKRTILNVAFKLPTFTCATYNVKSSTNGSMGTMISEDAWDFFSLSEDFSNLKSNLSSYTFGTRSRSATSLWGSDPKDGLGFATLNGRCSWSNEYIDEFDSEYGGLLDGANTSVDKGFRYYLVTLHDGVEVEVYITHMNTWSDSGTGHVDCQHAQLKEVATYIANHQSGRPVIFMGDTNLRYTRHDFETYFWSILRNAGLSYADPWAEFQWPITREEQGLDDNNGYPPYPHASLMVSDATSSGTDIKCSTTQNGEVVDKVIYINKPSNAVQIKAKSYLRDTSYSDLSDHMPIVVEFSYEKQ